VWTKPAAPPTQENIQGGYGSQSLAPFVRPQFRPVLISTAGENVVPETVLSFASEALLTQGKDSDGIIFDGSALPLKDGLALIDNLKIDPARR